MATEGRFRRVVSRVLEGWRAAGDPQDDPQPVDDKFVTRRDQIRVIRGGGDVDRRPGEKRGN